MRRILVPVDFTEATHFAVAVAADLATQTDGQLWLIHVAAPDPDFVGYEPGPQSVRDNVAREFHEEHQSLQRLAGTLRERGLDATALLIQGPTVEKILGEATRLAADVVVMGSPSHGAVHRAILGSVSEGVLREATCPVLIVPSRGKGS